MLKNTAFGIIALSIGATSTLTPALAWGPQGHSVVAMVAESRLSPKAREFVRDMLLGAPLVTAAVFADEYRVHHPETSRWHYVDVPHDAAGYDQARDCAVKVEGDCVISAMDREPLIMADPKAKVFDRADALKRLVHWIGDVHQPFHAIERDGDEGGNNVNVKFFGADAKLHGVWDSGLIRHTGMDAEAYTKHIIDTVIPSIPKAELDEKNALVWAANSHKVANAAYVAKGTVLEDAYFKENIVAVDRQLALAGAHLAAVLELSAMRAAENAVVETPEAIVMPFERSNLPPVE